MTRRPRRTRQRSARRWRPRVSAPTSVRCWSRTAASSGAFGIHSRSPRVWTPDEIALVAGSRRSDLGDARAPQGGSRAARERGAAGVSSAAERRAPPVERSRRPSRRPPPGFWASTSASPASATRNSSGGEYIIRREYTQRRPAARRTAAGAVIDGRASCARRSRRGETVVVGDVQTDPRLERRRPGDTAGRGRSRRLSACAVQRRADGRRVRRQSRHAARLDGVGGRAGSRRRRTDLGRRRAHPRRSGAPRAETAAPARARSVGRRLLDVGSPRPIRSTGTTTSAPCTGSRPKNPPSSDAWFARVHVDDRPRLLALLEEILTRERRIRGRHLPARAP